MFFVISESTFVFELLLDMDEFSFALELVINKVTFVGKFSRNSKLPFAIFNAIFELSIVARPIFGSVGSLFEVVHVKLTDKLISIFEDVFTMDSMLLAIDNVTGVSASICVYDIAMYEVTVVKSSSVCANGIHPDPLPRGFVVLDLAFIVIAIPIS